MLAQDFELTQTQAIELITQWAVQVCRSLSTLLDKRGLVVLD